MIRLWKLTILTTPLRRKNRYDAYGVSRRFRRCTGLTGENVSTRSLEAIKYRRQQTSLAVSMGRMLE